MKLLGAIFSGLMCLFGVGDAVCTIIENRQERKKEQEKAEKEKNLEEKEES